MRRVLVIMAAVLAAGVFAVVPASAAPAASVCSVDGGDPDGFTGKRTRASAAAVGAGRTVAVDLRSALDSTGQQFAWAKISAPGGLLVGDRVWVEITTDSGATWAVCGTTAAAAGVAQVWTHGFATSQSASVRMVGVVETAAGAVARTPTW
ncbi:hypothetical protein ACOBQX_01645 [Actinokineospora sp. G85]|uniref:hypothetical protein n=1 Tax=Actinokineospora sp. G85 TaxID=3406626 RepID=UPI003C733A7F